MLDCLYLLDKTCSLHPDDSDCVECVERRTVSDLPKKWIDPLQIIDRQRSRTDSLRGMLAGGAAFLMGGGPSANDVNLDLLLLRGVWTLAINNAAGHPKVRPQAMVCSDPPRKFSHSIWLDPQVMKFIPTPKMKKRRGTLRRKTPEGFELLGKSACDSPNVWGFRRDSWLRPDNSFFRHYGASWGNHKSGVERTGQPKTVCTMLLGLRLLYYLGARRIYLLGVDFRMTPDAGYSFGQARDEGACRSNSGQFVVVNDWLCKMQAGGVFEQFGLSVYNTYEKSGLRAFPFVPFVEAVEDCRGGCEIIPDLSSWYDPVK